MFDLGGNRKVQQLMRQRLIEAGATFDERLSVAQWVNTSFNYKTLSDYAPRAITAALPAHVLRFRAMIRNQLAEQGLTAFRVADDYDVKPITAYLTHVVAHCDVSGNVRNAPIADVSKWMHPRLGYVATFPNVVEIHHVIRVLSKKSEPPIQLGKLATKLKPLNIAFWEVFKDADDWCFRSTTPIQANGDLPDLASKSHSKFAKAVKTLLPQAKVTVTVVQVMACWTYPLDLLPGNRYRMTFRHRTGSSEQHLPNLSRITEQCLQSRSKFVATGDDARARIAANLEPFRRAAMKQGVRPLVMALAIMPLKVTNEGLSSSGEFCTQAAAYGSSPDEAGKLLEAFRRMIVLAANSGFESILSPSPYNAKVDYWADLLPVPNLPGGEQNPTVASTNGDLPTIATGEQTITLARHHQYKRIEDAVLELIVTTLGESKSFDLNDTGLMAVLFPTDGERTRDELYGCLFGLITAPGLNQTLVHHVASCEKEILSRCPRELMDQSSSRSTPAALKASKAEKEGKSELRKKQARQHDTIWNALEVIMLEPLGTRWKSIPKRFPEVYALLKIYPKLMALEADIESPTNVTPLVEAAWSAMTGLKRSALFKWRKNAGLPLRRLR